jgi:hypothetical protein
LLKDPKQYERDIVKEMGTPLTEPFKHKVVKITNTPTGDISEMVDSMYYPQSSREPEPPVDDSFEMPETGADFSSLWSQIAPTIERGIGTLYGIASEPLRASERIMERFRPRKLPQEMTEQERFQKIREGPPTIGKSVGALSDVASDVVGTVPIFGDDVVMAKLASQKIPFLAGSVAGYNALVDLAESGAVTTKGRSVMEGLLNLFDPKYEGKLWEKVGEGFPSEGAYGVYRRLLKQAPGTGIKYGGLGGERRFLSGFHDDIEVARRIYNADPVLMEYMPRLYNTPKHSIMMVKDMAPIDWSKIKDLPIAKQRQLFISFAYHARRLGKRLEKYGIQAGDIHMSNWGITKDGKVQIMDIGGWSAGNSVGAGESSGQKLLEKAAWQFSPRGHPGIGRLNLADAMAGKLKKGNLSDSELAKPEFWEDVAREVGKGKTPSPATVAGPPLSAHAPNEPEDIVKAMGKGPEERIGIRGADLTDKGLQQRIDFHQKNLDRSGARSRLESLQIERARRVQRGEWSLGEDVIADPGTPSDSLMRELDAADKILDDLLSSGAGTRTREDSLKTLKTRLRMYKSLDASRAGKSHSDVWKSNVARMEREIAKREGEELEILGPAGTSTRRRYGVETVPKKLTSDPEPWLISDYDDARRLYEKHTEKGNKGAALFWKNHMAEIKRKQGWTGPSRTPKDKFKFPSGSPEDAPVDPSNIGEWSITKTKGRIKAAEKLVNDPELGFMMKSRVKRLKQELTKRRRAQQRPRDITKEIAR